MPRGSKKSYTGRQKRQASKITASYRKKGLSSDKAEERAWRTVNKLDGGGKKSGSGRGRSGAAKTAKSSRTRASAIRQRAAAR